MALFKQPNRTIAADGLERFDEYIRTYGKNKNHPLVIIASFYKGNVLAMLKACLFLAAQRSPVWVIPLVTANIVDEATHPGRDFLRVILLNLGIALLFLLQNIGSNYLATRLYAGVNRSIEGSLRNALIRKLQYLTFMFHKEIQSGRLQSKVMRDVENIYELLNQIFRTLFFFLLDFVIAISITLQKSPTVFLFFIIVIPFTVMTVYFFRRPIKQRNRAYRSEMEQTQGAVSEMLEMIPVTRAHGLQEVEIHKMNRYIREIVNRGYRLDMVNSLFGAVSWVLFQGFQILCLAFTGYLACRRQISVGEVVLFQTYFTQIVGQISVLLNIYPLVSRGVESVRSVGEILAEPKVEKNHPTLPLGTLNGQIDFVHVDYRYPRTDKWVLKDFNLNVRAGESIAFVGESGAGKSTILNLLIGFIRPCAGQILIDGKDLARLDINNYRQQIAVVPQKTILFSGTLRDNITYGLPGSDDAAVNRVIAEVGLDDLIQSLPDGLETRLGEHGDRLSGGQKQRVSIARALIRRPKLIIFDEATSALDSVSETQVQQAVERMMSHCTIFIVAHRLSTVKNADRIVLIKDGQIAEMGNYHQLIAKKGEFYHLKVLQS
ncbi:MAG: ABC transporter ATP-binding protein/permease [Sporolactobacillus sp.]|jgi:ATP-binding cassette subfamily B protein|nr:ABC transporter ATP-binding protein/permease [Sporolactobacillus sp.]